MLAENRVRSENASPAGLNKVVPPWKKSIFFQRNNGQNKIIIHSRPYQFFFYNHTYYKVKYIFEWIKGIKHVLTLLVVLFMYLLKEGFTDICNVMLCFIVFLHFSFCLYQHNQHHGSSCMHLYYPTDGAKHHSALGNTFHKLHISNYTIQGVLR